METEKEGKVWLAGAGPGDAGLLTLKTAELINKADVIVYDALISAEILSMLPEHTEKINVGKRSDHHLVPQEEINRILVRKAREGKKVVRLKGGDPFVFGRGGEELELLVKNRIPFEIVPGITSGIAVPAYAGIPVTHRDCTSSFHVITGHARRGKSLEIDYDALVRLNATLIFLMGVTALKEICTNLIKAGMDPDMPAAIIQRGTWKGQKTVVSSVEQLPEEAERKEIQAPAVIVVGKVCQYAEQFAWMGKRPLGGRQFVVTRPKEQASELARRLRMLGAQVIELPSIRTEGIHDKDEKNGIRELLLCMKQRMEQNPEHAEWIVFTSAVGVREWFAELTDAGMDIRSFWKAKFAVIGKGTRKELRRHGIEADVMPERYEAKELGKLLATQVGKGDYVTAFRAREASEELFPPVQKTGAECRDVPVYDTIRESHEFLKNKLSELLLENMIDAVLFTSVSTVQGFVRTYGKTEQQLQIPAVCIGRKTEEEAKKYGMQTVVSEEATIDSMVELLLNGKGRTEDE